MKQLLKAITLLSVLVVSSCQDVVQVELEKGAKKYIIDAFINDLREPQRIRVIENNEYFSSEEPVPVTNAVVVLRDLTIKKDYTFLYQSKGYYVFDLLPGDSVAITGHQYELNVTIGGVLYKSLATQKRTAFIDSIIPELIPPGSGSFGPPSTDSLWMVSLSAYDVTDMNTDYYWIKTFRNDSLLFGPSDINVSIDGTNGPVMIEGVPFTAFTPPVTFMGFKMYRRGNTCKAEVHSISRETYFFFVQANNQINNTGLFATTPENIKTNIITPQEATYQASGWFNMASVAAFSITIK